MIVGCSRARDVYFLLFEGFQKWYGVLVAGTSEFVHINNTNNFMIEEVRS